MILVPFALAADDYARAWRQWTEEKTIYDGWDAALLIRATLLSPEMRTARSARLSAMTGETSRVDPLGEDVLTFVLTTAVANREDASLTGTDAAWTLHAEVAGADCGPPVLEKTADPTPADRAMHPKLTRWDTVWTARFVGCAPSASAVLRVDGPRGHGEMRWADDRPTPHR